MVGFTNRITDELKEKISAAFDDERKKGRRARWSKNTAWALLVLALTSMLVLEIRGDLVSKWLGQIAEGAATFL